MEEGRKRGRETSMCGCLSHTPTAGTCPPTQACALTENWTSNPLVHSPALSPLSHTSQGYVIWLLSYSVLSISFHHIKIIFKDAFYPIIWIYCIIYLINILLLDADFFPVFLSYYYCFKEPVLLNPCAHIWSFTCNKFMKWNCWVSLVNTFKGFCKGFWHLLPYYLFDHVNFSKFWPIITGINKYIYNFCQFGKWKGYLLWVAFHCFLVTWTAHVLVSHIYFFCELPAQVFYPWSFCLFIIELLVFFES